MATVEPDLGELASGSRTRLAESVTQHGRAASEHALSLAVFVAGLGKA